MKKLTALIVSCLMAIVAVRYCYLIAIGGIKPVLATFLLFAIAVGIGMWTYMKSDSKKDLITNIANTADVCAIWSILFFLLFFGKETRYVFTDFEVVCIVVSITILFFWKISKRANMANIAINIVLVIGYFPTIIGLYSSRVNTESFSTWGVLLVSSIISMYNPIKEKDWLAIVYASRAVVLVIVILGLMVRIEIM